MATPEVVLEEEDGRFRDIQTGLKSISSSSIGSAGSASDQAPNRVSGSEMDEQRKQQMAYEYLCHLEETKVWIEACVKEELPPTTELEESLTNGVYLAQLANFFAPEVVPLRRIFDKDRKHFNSKGLHFRHTDNINFFIRASEKVGLPKVFYPETTDIYDRKNMPKLIYCIHALSLYLFKLGMAPQIQDLYGKAKFTEEEISAMRKELEKYGIQMPAFGKIGGILASEMPVDEAALHAAVIAINDAIDHQDAEGTMQALRNPSAHLTNIESENASEYQSALYEAKTSKAASSMAKSPNKEAEESDVYDTLLTQAEIQGNLNQVNERIRRRQAEAALQQAVGAINRALDTSDQVALTSALGNNTAGLSGVSSDNEKWYMQVLLEQKRSKQETTGGADLTQSEIQEAVNSANSLATTHKQMEDIVAAVNRSLDEGTPEDTHALLQRPEAMLPSVLARSAFLYHQELKKVKHQKQQDVGADGTLSHEDISENIRVLSTVVAINAAIEKQAAEELVQHLQMERVGLVGVEDILGNRYLEHLISVKQEKAQDCGVGKDDLTQIELQICVDFVNSVVQEETDLISAIAVINEAVDRGDVTDTLQSLLVDAAKLSGVHPSNAQLYQKLLAAEKSSKAQKADDGSAELWHNEIQSCLDKANQHSAETHKLAEGVVAVNQAIDEGDVQALVSALQTRSSGFCSVIPDCGAAYLTELKELKDGRSVQGCRSPWLEQRTSQGHVYYYNKDSRDSSWETPQEYGGDSSLLTKEQIQAVVSRQTAEYDRWTYMQSNEPMIVKLQAHWKGYLARKAYEERLHFMKEQLPAIIRIQACVRGFLQNTRYRRRVEQLHGHPDEALKIQTWARMNLARNRYQGRLKYFRDNVAAIVKLQAWFRANVAQNDYRKLVTMQEPPVRTVRKFLHLLEHSDADFEEELEIQRMRAKVVTEVRSNQHLEHDLNLMDIKIGLLVKNRITLQDVVHHGKKLKREKLDAGMVAQRTKGIKSLSKESRERLEAYQHLFYLLQTNPSYLAKLIFAMPQSRATNFMESVILTLYNYASNSREEYLLLKLFEKALREEILSKVDAMQDVVIGNPTVIRMVVNYNRGTKGQGALRDLLQPLVKDILNDKVLSIIMNPLDVYKAWINQMESETGEASKLPYDVDPEQAFKHEEVRGRVEAAMRSLRVATDKFLNSIVQSSSKIPYGMRYVAMTLRQALAEKFPEAAEDEILKVVGNLIYYRYMNPAIVAPDAFDVVSFGVERGLSPDQRHNLGSIAKLLQYAAMNKKFGGESEHLAALNDYISEAHLKFKKFFLEVTTVEDPEVMFNIDEFTDIVMLSKPVIYISVQEICDTHTLLQEHKDEIAGDASDPLFELLDDLGDAPLIADLLGEMPSEEHDQNHTQSAKTEISLTLTNKFEVPDDDDSDMRALFVRTKRMIVDVLMVQPGDALTEILETPATDDQEEEHSRLMKLREVKDQESKEQNVSRSTSTYGDSKLPLEGLKRKIIRNLRMLESQGLVTIKNDYQDIINAIAKDIRNQRRYRQRRRQEKRKLQATLDSLHSKSQFYEEQIDYYNQYIKVCLDNLAKKGKKPRAQKGQKKEEVFKGEVKYTAQRLYEKGVILEIEGLPPAQFKNVMFVIKSGEEVGSFEVSAKFMGVAMEKVELVFQDLLQLQYEGVAVMKMFGRAKINVNLLIFLLNRKFYGK